MPLLESLASKIGDYVVDRCSRKQGCSLDLRGIQRDQRRIVDCDVYIEKRRPNHKLCDYIIFCELPQTSVSVIEMKSGGFSARQVAEQLRGGAGLADQWLAETPIDDFIPVLLSNSRKGHELRVLKRQKVFFRGKPHSITKKQCGAVLSDMITG